MHGNRPNKNLWDRGGEGLGGGGEGGYRDFPLVFSSQTDIVRSLTFPQEAQTIADVKSIPMP